MMDQVKQFNCLLPVVTKRMHFFFASSQGKQQLVVETSSRSLEKKQKQKQAPLQQNQDSGLPFSTFTKHKKTVPSRATKKGPSKLLLLPKRLDFNLS